MLLKKKNPGAVEYWTCAWTIALCILISNYKVNKPKSIISPYTINKCKDFRKKETFVFIIVAPKIIKYLKILTKAA